MTDSLLAQPCIHQRLGQVGPQRRVLGFTCHCPAQAVQERGIIHSLRLLPHSARGRDRRHRHTTSGRAVGGMGAGRFVEPIRCSSMAAAAARPSAMAQTISDCPRPASPATNTSRAEVA